MFVIIISFVVWIGVRVCVCVCVALHFFLYISVLNHIYFHTTGALTDACVWLYVFEDISLELRCLGSANRELHPTFQSFIQNHLCQARHYFTLDEIGINDFKLQCYFITHFIYVASDWGMITLLSLFLFLSLSILQTHTHTHTHRNLRFTT